MKDIHSIIKFLRKEAGKTTAVVFDEDPFIVLIATVISQRTKDANTEKAADALFRKYNTAKKIANANIRIIEKLIRPSGFYKVKAKRIKKISRIILEKYKGKVPNNLENLLSLPGVGRKTANCVLVFGFRKPAIPVDTHVHRISNRLGLVKTRHPEETETRLMKLAPKKYWIELNEIMVRFGQRKCFPRNPRCEICSLNRVCEYGIREL